MQLSFFSRQTIKFNGLNKVKLNISNTPNRFYAQHVKVFCSLNKAFKKLNAHSVEISIPGHSRHNSLSPVGN